jgi:glycosyltransferase involved in cell wall biosynthesis
MPKPCNIVFVVSITYHFDFATGVFPSVNPYLPSCRTDFLSNQLADSSGIRIMSRPIRIIHIWFYPSDPGGVETYLLNLLAGMDRDRFQMDFVSHEAEACGFDKIMGKYGSKLFLCGLKSRSTFEFGRAIEKIVLENGPYDIMHSHYQFKSWWFFRKASQLGIPVRIYHLHGPYNIKKDFHKKILTGLSKPILKHYLTGAIFCSETTAVSFLGANWKKYPWAGIEYCGVDLSEFSRDCDRNAIRSSLGIPPEALVIGHLGRLAKVKNQPFLIDVLSRACKKRNNVFLLLVGDGPLRSEIEKKATSLGLRERVIFAGSRKDVPEMMSAMDAFIFPSWSEGLGLAMIEAQAAGLPCVCADTVPRDTTVIDSLVTRLSLSDTPDRWADCVIAASDRAIPTKAEALDTLLKSPFNAQNASKRMMDYYEKAVAGCSRG